MILTHKFSRYALIAGLAYLIDIGGFWVLTNLSFAPHTANLAIKILAALFGFYAHRKYTYKIEHKAGVYGDAVRYFGVALLYAPISTALLVFILTFINSPFYVKLGVDIALVVITYAIASKFVFIRRPS